ncbi:hypothetical protein [Saccharolobus islandicus]|uniref:hypothetical protein n=1 Tax=Saccharolobus islandicus TaxID=43080 RepID=UPI00037FD776|nr:hypothetical protein [Sulfolobus islandicus]
MKVGLIFQSSRRLLSILNREKNKNNNFQICDNIHKLDNNKNPSLILNVIFYILHINLAFIRGRDL